MDVFTPEVLCDLYAMLSEDGKAEFLKRLGWISTPKTVLAVAEALSPAQRRQFAEVSFGQMAVSFLPVVVQHVRRIISKNPNAHLDEKFDKEVEDGVRDWVERTARETGAMQREDLENKRNRKSDPETIRRNVEICDLRKSDPKKWSQGKLAKHFDVTDGFVRKVLRDESTWRKKLAALSTK